MWLALVNNGEKLSIQLLFMSFRYSFTLFERVLRYNIWYLTTLNNLFPYIFYLNPFTVIFVNSIPNVNF